MSTSVLAVVVASCILTYGGAIWLILWSVRVSRGCGK